jgi:hypothetical protein
MVKPKAIAILFRLMDPIIKEIFKIIWLMMLKDSYTQKN